MIDPKKKLIKKRPNLLNKPFPKSKSHTYLCSCFAHQLMVDVDNENNFVYFLSYDMSPNGNVDWKWQLKAIWEILIHGKLLRDDVVLHKRDAITLSQNILKEVK